jgi:hypothetical protein
MDSLVHGRGTAGVDGGPGQKARAGRWRRLDPPREPGSPDGSGGLTFLSFTSLNSASTTSSSSLPCRGHHRVAAEHRAAPAGPAGLACRVDLLASFCAGFISASVLASIWRLVVALQASSASFSAASIATSRRPSTLSPCSARAFFGPGASGRRPGCGPDQLELLLVVGGVGFGVLHHRWISSSVRPEFALMVILFSLPVALSLARHVQDAVGVDVEGHLDLRHAARRGGMPVQVELGQALVAGPDSRSPCSTWMVTAGWLSSAVRTPARPWSGWSCSSGSAWSSRRRASRCPATAGSRRAAARP